ncbi:TonB C-terminal domain-containing protein [Candidatus Poribacteria bacterium]|nr:TonB C-terminal domain-containing protein [Candidatus Poribacteria bacterium]
MSRMLMYSVVFHLCLITSFMMARALNLSFRKLPIIYSVDLVDMSRPGAAMAKQVSSVIAKKLEQPKPKPVKETKKAIQKPPDKKQVALASQKKVETPKKEKTPKPKEKPDEAAMSAAPPKKEEPVESEEEPVRPEPKQVASKADQDFVTSGDPGDVVGPGNVSKDLINPELRWYIEIIRRKVWQNWIEPRHVLTDGVHARVVIRFEIGRDGGFVAPPEVFETSNVPLVDQSGYRAVLRAAPFPPLPESYRGNIMGIRFGFEYGENA